MLATILGALPLQIPVHASGIYFDIWKEHFGWSRTEVASALSLYTAVVALSSPIVGALIDRLGARWPTVISLIALIPAFLLFTTLAEPIWTLYLAYGVFGVVGASTTSVAFSRAVAQRFVKARGQALALSQCTVGVSLFVTPMIVLWLLDKVGWRNVWICLALIAAAIVPLVHYGLGNRASTPNDPSGEPVEHEGTPFQLAVRSWSFWAVALCFAVFFFGTAATMAQIVPMVVSIGLSRDVAVAMQGSMALTVLVGRIGSGFLLDRMPATLVFVGVGCCAGAGFAVFLLGLAPFTGLATAGIGLALGAELDICSYMIARRFGLRDFGKIFGLAYALLLCGGMAAHPFYGFVFDSSANYRVATGISMIIVIVAPLALTLASGGSPGQQSMEDQWPYPRSS